jgi:hypothetical protein
VLFGASVVLLPQDQVDDVTTKTATSARTLLLNMFTSLDPRSGALFPAARATDLGVFCSS